ncbi:MAG: pilin [Parcubacteria group bacterium]
MSRKTLFATGVGLFFATLVIAAFVSPVYAQDQSATTDTGQFIKCTSSITASDTPEVGLNCDFCDLLALVNAITTYAVGLLGMISSFMIFVSGYLYVTSAGDEQRIEQSKTTLKFSIIGFVIALLSGIIVKTVVVQLFMPEGNRPTGTSTFGTWNCKDIALPEPAAAQPDTSSSTSNGPPVGPFGSQGFNADYAKKILGDQQNGITWSPSVNFTGVQGSTLNGLKTLLYDCKSLNDACAIHINSVTDGDHDTGFKYSHYNGYKADLALNPYLTGYIRQYYDYVGVRGDGSKMYRDKQGNYYAYEVNKNHWDVSYCYGACKNGCDKCK